MSNSRSNPSRRRIQPVLLVAGVAASVALAMSMTGTLSAFVASITNSQNTAASGTVVLQETGLTSGGVAATCTSTDSGSLDSNAFACSTINKYGGKTAMVPTNTAGTSNLVTTTETFKNIGTATAASFTLTPGACTQTPVNTPVSPIVPSTPTTSGSAADFCSKLNVVIKSTTGTVVTSLFSGTAAALAGSTPIPVPTPNGATTETVTFTVSIDSSAGNNYQGLAASQPLTWTLSS